MTTAAEAAQLSSESEALTTKQIGFPCLHFFRYCVHMLPVQAPVVRRLGTLALATIAFDFA